MGKYRGKKNKKIDFILGANDKFEIDEKKTERFK